MKNLKEIIKATLFVAGEGIDIDFISEKLEVKKAEVTKAIEQIKAEIPAEAGIVLISYKNKVQLASNPDYAEEISAILNPIREKNLTRVALETLAIIAYKQPITKTEIEDIRGSSSDYAINLLSEHKLIEVVGRKDAVGKPLLYGTTEEFLKRFSLNDIDNLPNYEELLERIALIKQEQAPQQAQEGDGLYFNYELGENRYDEDKVMEQLQQELDSEVENDSQSEN